MNENYLNRLIKRFSEEEVNNLSFFIFIFILLKISLLTLSISISISLKELKDDNIFYYTPHKIKNNILLFGRKKSSFPFHLLVKSSFFLYFSAFSLLFLSSTSYFFFKGWSRMECLSFNVFRNFSFCYYIYIICY